MKRADILPYATVDANAQNPVVNIGDTRIPIYL